MDQQLELLLTRDNDPSRPSVENRVAFQWERPLDTLAYRNATIRDETVLGWMTDALGAGKSPKRVLDIGCGYGNHLLMLNARLGRPTDVELVGVDLYPESMEYARSFAETIPGYSNCSFQTGNLEQGLDFPDHSFDIVNLADVLEHLVDPEAALRELTRVAKPGGTIVISTPLKTTVFKRLAAVANRLSRGRIADAYYAGKGTRVEDGKAVMEVHAGHDHISEMEYEELVALARRCGCTVRESRKMPVMSGSSWFDRHPFLLTALMGVEAVHTKLQRPSWAHGIVLRLQTPVASAATD